jgi:thiamine pyrophosphokinase
MHTVIVCNGNFSASTTTRQLLRQAEFLIGVDGGSNHLAAIQVTPQLILGDLDSISPETLVHFRRADIEINTYPAAKDATDLELALDLAVARSSNRITILGGLGGRWDMSLANILLATADKFSHPRIEFYDSSCYCRICRPPQNHHFFVQPQTTFSLIPLAGSVTDIELVGASYPLTQETLVAGTSRGISNTATGQDLLVTFASGILLVMVLTTEYPA